MIVLSPEGLASWRGSGADHDDLRDYDQACNCDEDVTAIPVGSTLGVVVGVTEGYATSQWLRHEADWIVVSWAYGDDGCDDRLLEALLVDDFTWHPVTSGLPAGGGLHLLHAASMWQDFDTSVKWTRDDVAVFTRQAGREPAVIGDMLTVPAPHERYDVEAAPVHFTDAPEGLGLLCRFAPVMH